MPQQWNISNHCNLISELSVLASEKEGDFSILDYGFEPKWAL